MEQDNHGEKKSRLEIFKYNAILSILFFIGSSFYLSSQIPKFNFSVFTISQLSYFLDPKQLTFFNSLFFIKALLDLGFWFYVFRVYKLKIYSPAAFSFFIAILSFGLLGFFPTHRYFDIHLKLVYALFFFWTLSEFLISRLTKRSKFEYFTNNLLVIQTVLILLFLITDAFNGVFEIAYMLFVFLWLMVFISKYL